MKELYDIAILILAICLTGLIFYLIFKIKIANLVKSLDGDVVQLEQQLALELQTHNSAKMIQQDLKAELDQNKALLSESEKMNAALRVKAQQTNSLNDKVAALENELKENLEILKIEVHKRATAEEKNNQLHELKQLLSKKEVMMHGSQQEVAKLNAQNKEIIARGEEEHKALHEKIELLQNAEKNLNTIFENTANKIFEKKQITFKEQSKESLSNTIDPLKKEFEQFKKKVEEIYVTDSKDRQSISDQIKNLQELNQKISQEAVNLTKALKGDKKKQGNWGEIQLERILEESGLEKGREYITQVSLVDEDGKRRQPDVIVRLPENKDLIIDSKVSLVDYEKYCSSEDEVERQQALNRHTTAIKNHIDSLSFKAYENLEGIRTLDFVLIFIPIEPAFLLAVEADPSMFQNAFEKNIIVVSPTTLIPTLRTVHSIWRYERQNKNAEAIAKQAGDLHDKFVGFIDSMEKVGNQIASSQKAYEKAHKQLVSGSGNIVGRTQKLKELGAKTRKSIPDHILDQAETNKSLITNDN